MLVSSARPKGQFMTSENQSAAPPPPETIEVGDVVVACDGGGPLGHPRVFINLVDGVGECGYCDRRFVLKPGTKKGAH
jgi:uncharacterized Zn-finger protein